MDVYLGEVLPYHTNRPLGVPSGWEESAAYLTKGTSRWCDIELYFYDHCVCIDYYLNLSGEWYDWTEVPDA